MGGLGEGRAAEGSWGALAGGWEAPGGRQRGDVCPLRARRRWRPLGRCLVGTEGSVCMELGRAPVCDTGGCKLWDLQMASLAPVNSSQPGWSRDGKEKGTDGGDTEIRPQSQPGWSGSGWGRGRRWQPWSRRDTSRPAPTLTGGKKDSSPEMLPGHPPSSPPSHCLCPDGQVKQHPKAPDVSGAKQHVARKGCGWVLAIKWDAGGKTGI